MKGITFESTIIVASSLMSDNNHNIYLVFLHSS